MWTAADTARALRGERAAILRHWQTEAQLAMPYQNRDLFARRGEATLTANRCLETLIDCYQKQEDQIKESAAAYMTADEDAVLPISLPAVSCLGGEPCPATKETCSEWLSLPFSWPELRQAILLLSTLTRQALENRQTPALSQLELRRHFDSQILYAAEIRIRRLEEELAAQQQQTIETQQLAGRFIGVASHEIRTPLTAVLGFAELLLEETYGSLNEQQSVVIGHIENSAKNLHEVVSNLLDMMQVRVGKLRVQIRPVEIVSLMQELSAILLPLSERKKVHFETVLPPKACLIASDENILRHILYTVLASSLRATAANGEVIWTAECTEHSVTFITHDTALHLPPEAMKQMSEMFPRLEDSPARGWEDWEVGVPLVKRYVEMLGGQLELSSLPEQGTRFLVALPINTPPPDID